MSSVNTGFLFHIYRLIRKSTCLSGHTDSDSYRIIVSK